MLIKILLKFIVGPTLGLVAEKGSSCIGHGSAVCSNCSGVSWVEAIQDKWRVQLKRCVLLPEMLFDNNK